MDRRVWTVSPYHKDEVQKVAVENGINGYTALLLCARGITSPEEVSSFCMSEGRLCDPFTLPDMEKAVEAINEALQNGEKIAVYGDYDADGVTATVLLYSYLLSQGADVIYYIPDRNTEGYGMNIAAVDQLHADGVRLIVTVDNGISAFAEARRVKELGMKLVVTDHHKPSDVLPDALAVVDAHRKDCRLPFTEWAGVGVAFKLVCALEGDFGEELLDEYAQLLTIGTVADVVRLRGENRHIVNRGIEQMNYAPQPGIQAMKKAAGAADKKFNCSSVAFTLAPRINAVGRLGSVKPVVDLLLENGEPEQAAEFLNECNQNRQKTEQEILRQVMEKIRSDPSIALQPVILVESEGWHPGVIGIVAARLVEKYSKPCMIISCDGEDAKGSGRSIDGFSLFDALCVAKDYLTHYGGHTLAVGFSLNTRDIPKFKRLILDYAGRVGVPFLKLPIDCKLRPEALSLSVVEDFNVLEPFGAGNPQPLIGLYGVKLTSVQGIGGGKHLRLGFEKNGHAFSTVRFGVSPEAFPFEVDDMLDLAVKAEENEYNGERKLSIQIKAIRPAGRDDDGFLKGIALYEKILTGKPLSKDEAFCAYPDRGFVSTVYKLIKKAGGKKADLDKLCMTTGFDTAGCCKTLVSIEALCEIGVLERNDEGDPVLPSETVRAQLDQSELLSYLKSTAQLM